jgi:hypothetical protein
MRYEFLLFLATLLCLGSGMFGAEKGYGRSVAMEESTSISLINEMAADFSGKPVLVKGKAISMCMHQGCRAIVDLAPEAATEDEAIPAAEPMAEISPEAEIQAK